MKNKIFLIFLTIIVFLAHRQTYAQKSTPTTQHGLFQNIKNSDVYPVLALAATPIAIATIKLVGHATEQLGLGTTMLLGQAITALGYYQYKKYFPIIVPIPTVNISQLAYIAINGTIEETEKFHETLMQCIKDPQTVGIILKIDALGGNIGACQTLYHEIRRASSIKPVIALIEKHCCREAYLVASAANYIIANEQAIVGIVGTSLSLVEQKQDSSKELYCFYAGKLTPLGHETHHITPEDLQIITHRLEKSYEQLCRNIADQRNLSMDRVNDWADGKQFTGKEALHMQLIDHIGTLSDVYEVMAHLLKDRGVEHGPLVKITHSLT